MIDSPRNGVLQLAIEHCFGGYSRVRESICSNWEQQFACRDTMKWFDAEVDKKHQINMGKFIELEWKYPFSSLSFIIFRAGGRHVDAIV